MEISIIVPIYNIEKYIEKCIQSILEQTFDDIELILIDDCSTDKSGKICDKVSLTDKRVKVIHNTKRQGVSMARNLGLKVASGNYVMFVDGDDWIASDLCWKALEKMKRNKEIDTVHWGYSIVDYEGNQLAAREAVMKSFDKIIGQDKELFLDAFFVSYDDLYYWFESGKSYEEAIHQKKSMGSVWRYLFSRECIIKNNIKFLDTLDYGEDIIFLLNYIQVCSGIAILENYPYNYLVNREGALSHNNTDIERKIQWMEALEKTVPSKNEKNNKRCQNRWQGQRVLVVMNTARRFVKVESLISGYRKFKRFAKHPLCQEAYRDMDLSNAPFKYKCAIGMIKCHLYLLFYCCIWGLNLLNLDFSPMD